MTDVDRFEIIRPLGEGSGGQVLLARDQARNRSQVAIKRYRSRGGEAAAEYSVLSLLRHPLIPHALDLWDDPRHGATVVLPYLAGTTLSDAVANTPLSTVEWRRLAAGLLWALDRLHAEGFVHLDVKPDNLLVTRRGEHFTAMLIDAGFALPIHDAASSAANVGTPRYAAPEVTNSERVDERADLYSAATTLREVAGAVDRDEFDEWLAALGDRDARSRPSSAAAATTHPGIAGALDALRRERPDRLPYAPQRDLRRTITTQLERAGCAVVVGPTGAGKTALLEQIHREARLGGQKVARLDGRADDNPAWTLATQLGASPGAELPTTVATTFTTATPERVLSVLRGAGELMLLVDNAEAFDPEVLEGLVAVASGVVAGAGRVHMLMTSRRPLRAGAAEPSHDIPIPALTVSQIDSALRRMSSADVPQGLRLEAAQRLARDLGASPRALQSFVTSTAARTPSWEAALERMVSGSIPRKPQRAPSTPLTPTARSALASLVRAHVPLPPAILSGACEVDEDSAQAALAELAGAGKVLLLSDGCAVAAQDSTRARTPPSDRQRISAALARAIDDYEPGTPLAAAAEIHRCLASPDGDHERTVARAIERLRNDGFGRLALRLAQLAAEEGGESTRAGASAELGRTLSDLGRHRDADRVLKEAARSGHPHARARGTLGLAERSCRRGDTARATELAAAASEAAVATGDADIIAQAANLAAFVHYLRGEHADALHAATSCDTVDLRPVWRGMLHNAAGLAHLGQRNHDAARPEFVAAKECFEQDGATTGVLMVRHNLALLSQRMGRAVPAARDLLRLHRAARDAWNVHRTALASNNLVLIYRDLGHLHRARAFADESVRIREAIGERYGLGASLSNRATVRIELGDAAAALPDVERALELMRRAGAKREEVTVRKNIARALFALGRDEDADRAIRDALRLARRRHVTKEEADLLLLEGRLLLRAGDASKALRRLDAAVGLRRTLGDDAGVAEYDLEVGCAWGSLDQDERDERRPALLERLDRRVRESEHWEDIGRALLTRASVAYHDGDEDDFGAAADRAYQHLGRCERPRLHHLAATFAAEAAHRDGRGIRAGSALATAHEVEQRLLASAPGQLDPAIVEVRRRVEAAGIHPDGSALGAPGGRRWHPESLDRVLQLYRRLALATDVEPLLDAILDAALALTGASRAFLMVKDDDEAVVARSRGEGGRLDRPDDQFSRSILDESLATGKRIVVGDAAVDPHWREHLSVRKLRLRSVACMPLTVGNRTLGALYVDNVGRSEAFSIDVLELLERFADQASLALDRLRQEARIRALNRVLEQRLVRAERLLAAERRSGRIAAQLRPMARLVGQSAIMDGVRDTLERAALTDLPVLIVGESGTGKGVAARCIHEASPRRRGPFVVLDGGAIPETLFEAEVFGVAKGAFTGAGEGRPGLLQEADGGTLLLDKVDQLSATAQAKLLRAIEEGVVRPVGGAVEQVDIRVVAAASTGLPAAVEEGRFRPDLYFRLRGLEVELPPLRRRRGDILVLAGHFLSEALGKLVVPIRARAADRLRAYDWPGNVRELQNEMARLSLLHPDEISESHLSLTIRSGARPGTPVATARVDASTAREAVERTERDQALQALQQCGGNRSEAARRLGMSRYGFLKKLKRLGIP